MLYIIFNDFKQGIPTRKAQQGKLRDNLSRVQYHKILMIPVQTAPVCNENEGHPKQLSAT